MFCLKHQEVFTIPANLNRICLRIVKQHLSSDMKWLFWEKLVIHGRKSEIIWNLPPDLLPNQYTQIILKMAAWRARNGVGGPENWIIGTNVTLKGSLQKTKNLLRSLFEQFFISFSQKTVCTNTMRKELHEMSYKGRAAAKKLYISPATSQKRMQWARERRNRTTQEWRNFVCSDECKFNLRSDGRVYVWKQSGTRYNTEKQCWNQKTGFQLCSGDALL